MFPKLSLVLGGASSGKSDFAETLVKSAGGGALYLASAQAFDDEMSQRIEKHKGSRGSGWRTLEIPLEIAATLGGLGTDETVLFDCATLWLTNHLLKEHDIPAEQNALIIALGNCAANVVVVSNEVGHGVVPENPLARKFRDCQGQLNQAIAARADLVVLVTAGLPMVLKGELPAGTT